MRQTLQEIMTARDTLILLLQNLGFVINLKKLILHPVKQLEFLGLQKNTEEMTVSLRRKTDSDNSAMPGMLRLTKLIGLLSSTAKVILPGKIQFRFFQQEKIISLKKQGSYQGYVILGNLARQKLVW